MLDSKLTKKIEDFVYQKPRSIQEIAQHIDKNWRTADRYIAEIEKEFGTLSTRVFREGTRGALKIVFWASMEKVSNSIFQQELEEDILRAKYKEDFSAFDMFQFVPENKKESKIEVEKNEEVLGFNNINSLLESAEKQLLIFSGNLSFINFRNKETRILDILDKLVKKGVSIKIICRVDLVGINNIREVLSLNFKNGKDMIEIRHRRHPLRATIVDSKIFHIKEVREPTGRIQELDRKTFIFYKIKDKEWIEWITRIFWKMFNSSINANERLKELKLLRNINRF